MKRLILIPDGMADWKSEKLNGKTPLEYADTPNMDYIADEGACGLAKTVPDGFEPGSDIANLTILGVDVAKYYTGRGPIEALARGVEAKMAFRCNLVYVENGVMVDYSGRRIGDDEARKVIEVLNKELATDWLHFHAGRGYRHILAFDREFEPVKTTPPHDITGKEISSYLPRDGELAELLRNLMEKSTEIMQSVTEKANMIWPWSGGKIPSFPDFEKTRGVRGVMISEVDLLQGIGRGLGFEVVEVEGATGYVDTNYKGLAKAALRALKRRDFVVLHTEGIDEISHEGDLDGKIEAIEIYDEKIVGYLLDRLDLEEVKILLLPDHPTPVKVRTHVAEPVPFAIHGVKRDDVKNFSERACKKGRFGLIDGLKLMDVFFDSR
ncbi:cofactor-independent phosphoglycerate mutase [Archaeoglobus veneficus]|nr:cofactor-independent phosphoglycerate mutase [Archaeoglobus veneficus]